MIPYRPPERAGGTESFTRCRAQTLSPSGEPGVRIERTECRQSESPKPEKSKSPKGMRAQTTQSFPVIQGIGSVLFPLRVSACILIYGSRLPFPALTLQRAMSAMSAASSRTSPGTTKDANFLRMGTKAVSAAFIQRLLSFCSTPPLYTRLICSPQH
ncbi:hypothetical protein NDU88_001907 [Pleurodeles waltl]|uniref:Uncharacterized protein n=1 Tax=Pleurodeles waltl TaxID=8319 RepID=A0AAV7RCY5_PLEWA|nr:hypothetical protein NDU88_001907 [Pleurodeles waltl]